METAARHRADTVNAFFHPMGRNIPLVLPESLPGGVPPVSDYYAQLLDELDTGGAHHAG